MAASRALRSREIISQLVGDIGKLSNALDAEETSFTRSTGNEMNKTSEEEIMRVFGRSNDRRGYVNSASTATTSSAGILTAVPQLRATQPLKLGSEQESSGPLYSMRRNFSNQRIYGRGRNKNSKVKGSKASASGPFSRDLILLSGPNVRDVPRQGSKVDLQENGHIISAFNFRKEWSEIDVEVEIKNAFQGTLPDDVDFEILLSVHTTLSKPTLAPGQYLTGAVLSRVFKDNKPVYIRPSRELLDNTMPKKKKMALIDLESEEETKEDDDMDDYSLLPPALLTERDSSSHGHYTWGYGKTSGQVLSPEDWKLGYPHCGEKAQSPININPEVAKENSVLNANGLKLSFTKDTKPQTRVVGKLSNNGHAPTFAINRAKGTARITGGPLKDKTYELLQFHFHFGCTSAFGSEHTVSGKSKSGELHLVFYNTKYDPSVASSKPDGLAVIGVFLKQGKRTNSTVLHRLIRKKMTKVVDEGSIVDVTATDGITLGGILPNSAWQQFNYWTYKGSLTTPPCYQSVQWIVMNNKSHSISERDLKILRKLKADHGFFHGSECNNFRPTQPLNGRKIEIPSP